MNTVQRLMVLATLIGPAVCVAQQTQPDVTREQVRTELRQLEQAGYRPGVRDNKYPGDLQAAEARIAAGNAGHGGAYGPSLQ